MASKAKEIAALTGLSLPTIWHILGNKGHLYKPETRKKVIDAADKLGYRPNTSARAVSTGKFGCIALLMSTVTDRSSLPAPVLHGINAALAERDMHLSVFQLPDEKLAKQGFIPKILTQTMADGLLINYTHWMPDSVAPLMEKVDIPTVWINVDRKHDAVRPDDYDAGYRATQQLIGAGHERIAYLAYYPSDHYSVKHRGDGYQKAMREAGLKPRRISELVTHTGWRDVAFKTLRPSSRPTAIVAYGSAGAMPFVTAALELGMKVPADLSVVTFGGSHYDEGGISIATYLLPELAVGTAAVEMLLKKVDAPKKKIPVETVTFEGPVGDSVVEPPKDEKGTA